MNGKQPGDLMPTPSQLREAANYSAREDPIEMSLYLQGTYGIFVTARVITEMQRRLKIQKPLVGPYTEIPRTIEPSAATPTRNPEIKSPEIYDARNSTDGSVITSHEELAAAVKNSIGRGSMPRDQSLETASNVLKFFGWDDRIIDNVLEPEDRNVFYTLWDEGLLKTENDEETLYDGRPWRIKYWVLNRCEITRLASLNDKPDDNSGKRGKDDKDEAGDVYSEIPEDAWIRD